MNGGTEIIIIIIIIIIVILVLQFMLDSFV